MYTWNLRVHGIICILLGPSCCVLICRSSNVAPKPGGSMTIGTRRRWPPRDSGVKWWCLQRINLDHFLLDNLYLPIFWIILDLFLFSFHLQWLIGAPRHVWPARNATRVAADQSRRKNVQWPARRSTYIGRLRACKYMTYTPCMCRY